MKTMSEIIGERLKSLREKKNLSQAQLSKLCGWSTASRVGNYELGVRNVGVDDAVILAKVLGTTPSELLFGDQGDPSNWLTDKQKKVIDLFNQLPEAEQERMIDLFQLRLKEIDDYVEKYLRGRYKPAED
ncbi:helix-turn-helix domain-containing protein [Serratia marcescens]|uniref:helix-turn-helix domain-containing protein n=2 Tax=root TaxID=1 RepID=UPI000A18ACE8|nr:helix-turn-helix domain-containing protein [Serratia marcescens]QLJ65549.1 helix-turn-helix domain-containing protein [Serratia marcescens]HBC0623482.1 helix-turn-helix domain-containing protein [Serratia marcescens]